MWQWRGREGYQQRMQRGGNDCRVTWRSWAVRRQQPELRHLCTLESPCLAFVWRWHHLGYWVLEIPPPQYPTSNAQGPRLKGRAEQLRATWLSRPAAGRDCGSRRNAADMERNLPSPVGIAGRAIGPVHRLVRPHGRCQGAANEPPNNATPSG